MFLEVLFSLFSAILFAICIFWRLLFSLLLLFNILLQFSRTHNSWRTSSSRVPTVLEIMETWENDLQWSGNSQGKWVEMVREKSEKMSWNGQGKIREFEKKKRKVREFWQVVWTGCLSYNSMISVSAKILY